MSYVEVSGTVCAMHVLQCDHVTEAIRHVFAQPHLAVHLIVDRYRFPCVSINASVSSETGAVTVQLARPAM